MNQVQNIWQKTANLPFGKTIFSSLVCLKAPYFRTIHPHFLQLEPGLCRVSMKKRRSIQNHIGTIHAIAMCNLVELAAGTMTEISIPKEFRWIPKEMHVKYLAKAKTDLIATARIDLNHLFADNPKLPVQVNVNDSNDREVMQAIVQMWVTKKAE